MAFFLGGYVWRFFVACLSYLSMSFGACAGRGVLRSSRCYCACARRTLIVIGIDQSETPTYPHAFARTQSIQILRALRSSEGFHVLCWRELSRRITFTE
jgi:hypothetical protein